MRFRVEILLDNDLIPKDKNRIFLSLLKRCFETNDKEYFNSLYKDDKKPKSFTYAIYMGAFVKQKVYHFANRKAYH
ncbi:hypothetical protein HYG86_02670 [Alkalicella caledoniensis]|uniref:Uncharacterized protein n=1 Tax=Alkalicella caledoniensis TaxID=2731377 RepID=A0A7G9W4X6_ALKCA|nr:hypothetical protein [Alkalicella caledoniensis]QNO13738.1 hypothetical protein HYG86_02670 [Alkalicella caledoniensis]